MDKQWLFLTIILDVYPFIFLQYLPFRKKLKFGYGRTFFVCSLFLCIQFLGFVWLTEQPFYTLTHMLLYRCGLLVTLYLFTLLFVKDNFYKVLFVFSLTAPYVVTVICLGSFLGHLFHQPDAPPYMFSSLFRIGIILLSFPIFYQLEKRYLIPAMDTPDNSIWSYAAPIPVTFSVISLFFVRSNYETHGVPVTEVFGMLCIFVGCIFTCFFLLKALQQSQEKAQLAEQARQSNRLLLLQREQYTKLTKTIADTKVARHDLRHHLSVLHTLINQKDYNELSAYITKYTASLPLDSEISVCDNYAANSIATYYLSLAKAQGIDMDVLFHIDQAVSIDDIDLCIILGNCLENAVEGCQTIDLGKRYIKARALTKSGQLYITIDNRFDGITLKSGDTLISRKRNDNSPGIGLLSVCSVIARGNGQIKTKQKDDVFMVSICLPIATP